MLILAFKEIKIFPARYLLNSC